ncbi:MAG: MG2 domain-containing protein, partial [Myxococcales bacterium]
MRGSGVVDVRLYRLREPERVLVRLPEGGAITPGLLDPRHAAGTAREAPRAPGAFELLGAALVDRPARSRAAGLTPAAAALFGLRSGEEPHASGAGLLTAAPLVDRRKLPCGERGSEAQAYCDVDLGPRASGVYLVEAVWRGEVAWAVAVVSRLGVAVRHTPRGAALVAVDTASGRALADARVTVFADAEVLARGRTDAAGLFQARTDAPRLRVVAQHGDDWAVARTGRQESDAPPSRLYLVTDRGRYAPGEVVHVFGAVRGAPDDGEPVSLEVRDANGSPFHRARVRLGAHGTFAASFVLPAGLAEGLFRLGAISGEVEGGGELEVRRPAPRDYEVHTTLTRAPEGAGLRARVHATRDGGPVAGARLRWRAFAGAAFDEPSEPLASGEAETGEDGRA